jgi:phosphomannomutase|tara:strand:+ start:826 stop:1548 length:723 start_codon:yes stop_codon:yes gene_type:complete
MKFIFDVDGTLTPSRSKMDESFHEWFCNFILINDVYLATGSDAPKTIEQIGETLFKGVNRVYNCAGNSVWQNGRNVYNNDWTLPEEPWKYLESKLNQSAWNQYTGQHFDERPGLLNFSILGRKATTKQREMYVHHDYLMSERKKISEEFNLIYGDKYGIVSQVAGETGMDIMPVGKGKEQIIDDFEPHAKILFFGDMTMMGGNDFEIGQRVQMLTNGYTFQVAHWKETWGILKSERYISK